MRTRWPRLNPLSSAYLFQGVNIAVALLIVPLLLRYLSAQDYAMWLIFSAICGATVQVQSAILGVSTKEIAHAYHRGAPTDFRAALARSRRAYAVLASVVAGPVLLGAAVYLRSTQQAGAQELVAWAALIGAYALVYLYAPNNAVLLATEGVSVNNSINTATRLVYLMGTLTLLASGLTLLAPCLALAASSVLGVILNTSCARRHLALRESLPVAQSSAPLRGQLGRYGLFTLSSFLLYNGALLIVAPLFPSETASYGLALQTSALLAAMALIPLQVWLGRLVRADLVGEAMELRRSLTACNTLFATGYAGLIVVAPPLLRFIGAEVALPSVGVLTLMYAAFAVELNIFVLANHLTAKGDYGFTNWYALAAFSGLLGGTCIAWVSGTLWLGFLAVPLAVQVLFSLPYVVRRTMIRLSPARVSNA
jgi:hypothetical protein